MMFLRSTAVWLAEMSSAESCIHSFLAQARTLSLHLAAPLDSAHVPLTQPCASLRLTHRQGAHILLRMEGKVFGLGRPIITVVQPDHGKARDPRLRSEF